MVDTIRMWSEVLRSMVLLKVITPEQAKVKRLMILLHGKMCPEMCEELLDAFPGELALEELCHRYGMVVAVPLMPNRYYISGEDYDCKGFVAEELPTFIKERYGDTDEAEMILGGISMGGFGAVLIGALTGAFQKIISISGAFIAGDVAIGNPEVWGTILPHSEEFRTSFLYYFLPLEGLDTATERNATAALRLLQKERVTIVATCGTSDWLYSRNLKFVEEMDDNKVNYKFYSIENGDHEPECFKEGLWRAVAFLCGE